MDVDESVTLWIEGLRKGNPHSAQQLWERYFQQLVSLAAQRLPLSVKRDFDEEDVALSAFDALCRGIKCDRFPQLDDRESLWALLVVITARKAMHRRRDAIARKRGAGRVRGESVFASDEASGVGAGMGQILGSEPTAELAAQLSEETERLLRLLPDDAMRRLVILKMEGYTNEEIAQALDCGLRTVERRLSIVRKLWTTRG